MNTWITFIFFPENCLDIECGIIKAKRIIRTLILCMKASIRIDYTIIVLVYIVELVNNLQELNFIMI